MLLTSPVGGQHNPSPRSSTCPRHSGHHHYITRRRQQIHHVEGKLGQLRAEVRGNLVQLPVIEQCVVYPARVVDILVVDVHLESYKVPDRVGVAVGPVHSHAVG